MTTLRARMKYSLLIVMLSVILNAGFAITYVSIQNHKWCSLIEALRVPVAPLQPQANGQPPSSNVIAQYQRTVQIQGELRKLNMSFCG